MEPRLDKNTLPIDGSKVKWLTDDGENWKYGVYEDDEEMFSIDDSNWSYAFDVVRWEYLEEKEKDKSPETTFVIKCIGGREFDLSCFVGESGFLTDVENAKHFKTYNECLEKIKTLNGMFKIEKVFTSSTI